MAAQDAEKSDADDDHRSSSRVGPVTADDVLTRRFSAQLISGDPARTPEHVVERLLAVQAQDPRGARLSVRARTAGLTAADVDAALNNRQLVITWLNRGTLHLIRSSDYWWLHALTTPQLKSANARRLGQEGVSPAQADRGVDTVVEQVATQGPRTRVELRTALEDAAVPTAGQALVHLLFAASLAGHVVRGPMRDGEHCYVSVEDWLGPAPEGSDRRTGLVLLARRYLAGHGPADARDLAKWAGIRLGDARAAFAGISDEVRARPDGLVELLDRQPAVPLPTPRLLGPFDPLLHGWASRDQIIGPHRGIVTTNGLFRPFALVNGRAVATWALSDGRLTIRPLERIGESTLQALQADAAQVQRFQGLPASAALVEPMP